MAKKEQIVEKKLGIPADYQFKAIRSKNIFQKNWHKNKLVAVEHVLDFDKNKTVLDLGPGSGNFELIFHKRFKKIVGIDYNDEAVAFLRNKLKQKKIKNVSLKVSDVRNLVNYKPKEKFDYIVMIDVIEHIKIKDAEKVVKQMQRLLKKGGKACIITPNYKSTWVLIETMLDHMTIVPKFDNEQHLAKFYKDNLTEMFVKKGFETENISTFNLFSFAMPDEYLSKRLTKFEISNIGVLGNLLLGVFEKK